MIVIFERFTFTPMWLAFSSPNAKVFKSLGFNSNKTEHTTKNIDTIKQSNNEAPDTLPKVQNITVFALSGNSATTKLITALANIENTTPTRMIVFVLKRASTLWAIHIINIKLKIAAAIERATLNRAVNS